MCGTGCPERRDALQLKGLQTDFHKVQSDATTKFADFERKTRTIEDDARGLRTMVELNASNVSNDIKQLQQHWGSTSTAQKQLAEDARTLKTTVNGHAADLNGLKANHQTLFEDSRLAKQADVELKGQLDELRGNLRKTDVRLTERMRTEEESLEHTRTQLSRQRNVDFEFLTKKDDEISGKMEEWNHFHKTEAERLTREDAKLGERVAEVAHAHDLVAKALALKVEQLAPEVVQQPIVEGGAGRGTTFMCDVAERLCWLASELDKLQNANRNYDEALMDSLRAEFNALYEKLRPRIEDCEATFLNLEREVNQLGRNAEETRNQLDLTKGDLAALSQEQRRAAEVLAQHEDLLQYLNGHAQRVEKAVKDVGGLMKHIEGEHLQLASYCNQRLSEHEVLHPPEPQGSRNVQPKRGRGAAYMHEPHMCAACARAAGARCDVGEGLGRVGACKYQRAPFRGRCPWLPQGRTSWREARICFAWPALCLRCMHRTFVPATHPATACTSSSAQLCKSAGRGHPERRAAANEAGALSASAHAERIRE